MATASTQARVVLIVDDEADICEALAFRLEEEKYETETAGDVAHAIERMKARKFDLVICDFQMPNANGLKLLEYCQSKDKTPFVLMSGHTNISREKALSLGALDLFQKPLADREWLRRIAEILIARR